MLQYDFEATGFADTFCNAVVVMFNRSIVPLTVSFSSVRNYCITSPYPVSTAAEW